MTPVTQLQPPRPSGFDLEAKVLGAALHIGPAAAVLVTLGLTGEEFSVELYGKAWKAVLRQADAKIRPTHETVSSAGLARKLLTPDDCAQLERLSHENTLDLDGLRVVAREFRMLVQGMRTAAALEAEAAAIRSTGHDAARTMGVLSGVSRELARDAAQISDLTEDQTRLLDRWDSHQRNNTSDILATGIKVLDAEIGGLPQKLCLFAADAGVGKTALIDSMQHSMLLTHPELRIGLVSPEDGVEHVAKRWLARETGWLLREIGNRQCSREEQERLTELAAAQHPLLARILGYRERSITGDGLIALCWQMAERGCGCIFIDNFNKISLRGGTEDYHERVQRFSDRLSEFAEKAHVPAVLLVHNAGEEQNSKGRSVSGSGGLQGGRALGRDARFRIDLFRKGKELRGVIAKANELGEQGAVIQFTRQATAGLIDPDTGEKINVAEERRLEKEAEAAIATKRNAARKEAATRASLELREKLKAEKVAKENPQAKLLDVPDQGKP